MINSSSKSKSSDVTILLTAVDTCTTLDSPIYFVRKSFDSENIELICFENSLKFAIIRDRNLPEHIFGNNNDHHNSNGTGNKLISPTKRSRIDVFICYEKSLESIIQLFPEFEKYTKTRPSAVDQMGFKGYIKEISEEEILSFVPITWFIGQLLNVVHNLSSITHRTKILNYTQLLANVTLETESKDFRIIPFSDIIPRFKSSNIFQMLNISELEYEECLKARYQEAYL